MSGISAAIDLVDRVSGPLNRITASLYSTTSAFGNLDRASDIAFNPAGIEAVAQELYSYETRIQQLEGELTGAAKRLEEMEEQTKKTAEAGNMLKTAFGAVMALFSVATVQQVLETSDNLMQTTSRINMMNDNLQSTPELMDMIYQSAQNARGSFDGMASVVARFGNNARDAFDSSAEIVAFSELIQKQMTIAGAGTAEAQSTMLQLSQALGSGVLRGDELNSIFEQAPNLIQNIADYLDVPLGTIRSMAAEGQITADIVKNAVFSSADEINAKFEEMPMTWAQVGQSLENTALMAFQPFLQAVNDVTKNERFTAFMQSAEGAMYAVADMSLGVFDTLGSIAAFVIDNWSVIAPLLSGVIGIMGVYLGVTKGVELAQLALNGVIGAFQAIQTFVSIGYGVLTGSTEAAALAQSTYNSALLACPLTWILLIVIAVIAAFYAVIAVINNVAGTTVSATGIIFAAIATAVAAIWNIFLGLIDLVLGIVNIWMNAWIIFVNFFANVFNDPIGSIIHLFGGMADIVLGIIETIAKALDKVFNANLAGAVQGWRSGLDSMIESTANKYGNGSYEKVADELNLSSQDLGLNRWAYDDAYNFGYSMGEGLEDTVGNMFDTPSLDMDSAYTDTGSGSLLEGINNIAADTSNISNSVDISNENLKYLRDIAEREVVNRFTTAEIKIDMTNNNSISSDADIDGIVTTLSEGLMEAMAAAAEGVH